ncbi:MAG: ester cyclase [Nitrososphaeraceae archaeon]
MIPATNKKFKIDFCTVARWNDARIVEENLFYDSVGMMRQLGLVKRYKKIGL